MKRMPVWSAVTCAATGFISAVWACVERRQVNVTGTVITAGNVRHALFIL